MTPPPPDYDARSITSYVLAGGHSRRWGRDKKFIEIEGQPLWSRVCQLVESYLPTTPILVGNGLEQAVFHPYLILPDAQAEVGPLGGLVSALRDCPSPWSLVLPVDLPLLTRKDLERLAEHLDPEVEVIVYQVAEKLVPLPGLYRTKTKEFWERRLQQDDWSLQSGIKRLRWKSLVVPSDDSGLFNLNEPEDWSHLSDLLSRHSDNNKM